MKLQDFLTPDLEPDEFYEYLQEYSSDCISYTFTEEEQELIDEAWFNIKQMTKFTSFGLKPDVKEIAKSKVYLNYLKNDE